MRDHDAGEWPNGFRLYTPTERPWRNILSSNTRTLPAQRDSPSELRDACFAQHAPLAALLLALPDVFLDIVLRVARARGGAFRSVVLLSRACRRLRFVAKESMVWRELCKTVWRREGLGVLARELPVYASWRGMFVHRPRARLDGVYCFKWVSVRRGVNEGRGLREGDRDGFYKPVHVIPSYRLVQFKSDGTAAMMTTTADRTPPSKVLATFRKAFEQRQREPSKRARGRGKDCVHSRTGTVTFAEWYLCGDELTITSTFTLPDHPNMRPIHIDMKMVLASSREGANDILSLKRHTAGLIDFDRLEGAGAATLHGREEADSKDDVTHMPTRGCHFVFVPAQGFAGRVERLAGWDTGLPQVRWQGESGGGDAETRCGRG